MSRTHTDSRSRLQHDVDFAVQDLADFTGGRDGVLEYNHPGCLIGSIYDVEPNADVVLTHMIDRACLLANRSIMLGGHDDGREGGTVGHAEEDDDGDEESTDSAEVVRPRKIQRITSSRCPSVQVERLLETLYYLQQALKSATISHRLVREIVSGVGGGDVSADLIATGVERFSKMDVDDTNRLQNLLLYLLNITQSSDLRRNGTDVYQKIFTEDGNDTRAWKRTQSIKEFVYKSARKEINFDQWLNLTASSGNASAAADHLTYCHDTQFPTLVRDRHVFSFTNGIYFAETDEFVTYDRVSRIIDGSTAACKFFDAAFDDFSRSGYEDWCAIPTPSLQRILQHQEFPPDVCRWMYILIGRLIYDLNEHDGWQVIPYLMGQAGSGKSSILVKVCRSLYDIGDVGVLSNNLERKFGLAAFADKYLFIAPEIKQDLQLEQAEFQSLVSGEALQLNIKYKTAVTVDWVTPGIMAGNEFPNFKNNSGSIDRRVVVFEFINSVTAGDMELGKKLEAEMPALLKKSNVAYREMTAICGRNDVWSHLPSYFKERRKELAEVTNTLADFISNGPKLSASAPSAYIFMEAFKDAYREFCLKNHYAAKKLNESDIRSELRKYFPQVVISKKACHAWPVGCGVMRSGCYIENVGWRVDDCLIDDLL